MRRFLWKTHCKTLRRSGHRRRKRRSGRCHPRAAGRVFLPGSGAAQPARRLCHQLQAGPFEFEASLHERNDFGSPDQPGDIRTLFRDLGVEDKIDWIRIPEAYHMITTDKQYDCEMPFGIEAFIDKMEQYVPGSRKSMTEFFELCNEVRDAQTYSSSVNGNTDSSYMKEHFPNFIKAGSYSVNEVLDALHMPKKAQDILNAYWCYLGVDCDRMSFLHYGSMVIRYITRDAWMPKMRSHEISLALDTRIRELGGDIWYLSRPRRSSPTTKTASAPCAFPTAPRSPPAT